MPVAYTSQAITPSDLEEGRRIFDTAEIPRTKLMYYYNEAADCWEIHEVPTSTKKAERPAGNVGWDEV